MKYALSRLWIAITLSFIFSFPYVYRYSSKQNAFMFHWNFSESVALIIAIILGGVAFFSIFLLIRRSTSRNANRVSDIIFVIAFGLAVTANLCFLIFAARYKNYISKDTELLLGILIWVSFVIISSFAFMNLSKFKALAVATCYILSVAFPVFAINLMSYETYSVTRGMISVVTDSKNKKMLVPQNIFLFIFDGWSYRKTFSDKQLISSFRNLNGLMDSSIVFHNAFSPDANTLQSMSKILFNTDREFTIKNGKASFREKQRNISTLELENIFTKAKKEGYVNLMCGVYLPYADILNQDVDLVRSISSYKRFGKGFFQSVVNHLWGIVDSLPKPFEKIGIRRVSKIIYNQFGIKRVHSIHNLAISTINSPESGIFGIFHYPIPHEPFIFDKNGPTNVYNNLNLPPIVSYHNNLNYLDKIIGEIIGALKKTNKLKKSMIIITSDHGWISDPEIKESGSKHELQHVPLIISAPWLEKGIETEIPFNTSNLKVIIDRLVAGKFEFSEIEMLLQEKSLLQPLMATDFGGKTKAKEF